MKLIASLAAFVLTAFSFSQELPENHQFVSAFFGKSAILLGSSDIRLGAGLSYGYGKHEPRFETRFATAQLVYEGYYDHTRSNATHGPYADSDALGFLFYGRWFARMPRTSPRPFFDLGWGFQYADRTTPDLPSEVNSTPFADLGYAFPFANHQQLMLSLRYLHISNAGFVKPNRGQNEIFLMASVSF